jgi:IclR family acetate operon transcriptional repressor
VPQTREKRSPAGPAVRAKPVIQSGARMVRLIYSLIRSPNGRRLSDLGTELSLPKATVLRLLQTLVGEGIAEKDPVSGVYRMNSLFWLAMCVSFPDARLVQREVQEVLEWLARRSSATALLIIPLRGRRKMAISGAAFPEHPLVVYPPKDIMVPAHALAAGKCFLASLPDDALRAWLAQGLPAVTDHTITSSDVLLKEIEQVRARGYALHREELSVGCWGVAVPVLADTGDVVAMLQLSAPLSLMTADNVPRWLSLLQRAATQIAGMMLPSGRSAGAPRPQPTRR